MRNTFISTFIKNLQLEQAYQAIEIKPISIAEQKKLAKTIRTIDGKTAINRSINQNLPILDRSSKVGEVRLVA